MRWGKTDPGLHPGTRHVTPSQQSPTWRLRIQTSSSSEVSCRPSRHGSRHNCPWGSLAARTLARRAKGSLEIVLVSRTDFFLSLPLLPEVAGGTLDPRRVAAPLTATCRGVRQMLGAVTEVDIDARQVVVRDPEDSRR